MWSHSINCLLMTLTQHKQSSLQRCVQTQAQTGCCQYIIWPPAGRDRERKGTPARRVRCIRTKGKQSHGNVSSWKLRLRPLIPWLLFPLVVSEVYIPHWQEEQPVREVQKWQQLSSLFFLLVYLKMNKILKKPNKKQQIFFTSCEHPSTVSTCSTFTWGINSARLKKERRNRTNSDVNELT